MISLRKISLALSLFILISLPLGMACDYYVDSCQDLSQANKIYCMNQSFNGAQPCITFSANNITFDCQNYAITGGFYNGITVSGVNQTVEDCYSTSKYPLILDGASYSLIKDSTFEGEQYVYLANSDYNTFDNVVVKEYYDALYIRTSSDHNVFLGGNYYSKWGYQDYKIQDATNNTFRRTGFTTSRKIFFESGYYKYFIYNNETTGGIWHMTKPNTANTGVTRLYTSLTQDLVQWNDTGSAIFYYNITGLNQTRDYKVYDNGVLAYTLETNANGELPQFSIDLSSEHEIKVEGQPITIKTNVTSPTNTTYTSPTVWINGSVIYQGNSTNANITWSMNGNTNQTACNNCSSFSNQTSTYVNEGSNYVIVYSVKSDDATKTDIDTVYFSVDTSSPTYSDNSTSRVKATIGNPNEHRLKWNDYSDLSGYVFSFDNCTGSFINDTWIAFGGGSTVWSNVTKTINTTKGCTIRWKVYANDTFDYWNTSDIYSYQTTTDVSDCVDLNVQGETYNMTSDITYTSGDCINMTNTNIIFDCGDYYIDGSSSGGHGFHTTSHGGTIKNCLFKNIDTPSICLFNEARITIDNVTTASTCFWGIDLYGGSSSSVVRDSDISASQYVLIIDIDSDYNIIENTNLVSAYQGATVANSNCDHNLFIDSPITGGTRDDYEIEGGANNTFRNTEFVGQKTVYIRSALSWFEYNNETTGGIWHRTGVASPQYFNRTYTSLTTSLVQWNDSGSGIFYYNISGLTPSSNYKLYNNSVYFADLETDGTGKLPQFTINLSSEHEIKVEYSPKYLTVTFNYSSVSYGSLNQGTSNNPAPNQATGVYNTSVNASGSYEMLASGTNFTGSPYSFGISNLKMGMNETAGSLSVGDSVQLSESSQTIETNITNTTTENYHGYWLSIPAYQYATSYSSTVIVTYQLV